MLGIHDSEYRGEVAFDHRKAHENSQRSLALLRKLEREATTPVQFPPDKEYNKKATDQADPSTQN